ncbi:MAG: hypothetical protein HZT43_04495 [Exiguobacterium profundum]|nr:MAG: hypothetical protein HZT43_04495 [Exiguobacterium profundum]
MTHTADMNSFAPARAHTEAAASRGVAAVFYLIAIALAALVLAVSVWGLVALTFTALALVPVMMALLIAIGWPRS